MITFDVLTLQAFLDEEKEFLAGARINKIQQPTRREFILTLRKNGTSRLLYINITPKTYHICFMNKQNAQKRHIEIPPKPPMFCMQLRKYLENAKIAGVHQPKNERILELYIQTYSEIGVRIYLCLAVELMGKYSNVILYNTDTNIIIGCAHNVGSEKSRKREIYGGIPYIYPPGQNKFDITNYKGEINYETLQDNFYMISKSFAKLCKGVSLDKLKSYIRLENLTPCISKDFEQYCLFSELLKDAEKFSSVNEMIDAYYAHYVERYKFNMRLMHYKTIVLQQLKKTQKSLANMIKHLRENTNTDKYRIFGDLIMANLYNLSDYTKQVQVYYYENDKNITIELDPHKTLKDNANTFYKLYNKGKTTKDKISTLIAKYNVDKVYLEQILYSMDTVTDLCSLEEIVLEIINSKIINTHLIKEQNQKTVPQKTSKKHPDIMSIDIDCGGKIYIGKNNKQNDYIVSKLADEDDLWFHVHNCAGSHVLLKSQNITDDMILRCANLAKEYSAVKNSTKVGVIYTRRKYLRKPPGANLGYVTYRQEKEILVD